MLPVLTRALFLPLLLCATTLLLKAEPAAGATEVPVATNLRHDSELSAKRRLPILLVVSQEHCPFCELLKREVIRPMIISGEYVDKVIIRELFMDPGVRVRDFDGKEIDAADLARRYDVSFTPTLLLLAPDGKELTERIVGVSTLDMYGYYLDGAIDSALQRLRN